MQEISLAANAGRPTGSSAARRLRASGKIPAVLYGHGIDPTPLAVDAKEFRHALSQEAGVNALISLELNGTRHLAMARQLQRNPVRGTVDHVDFVIVRRDEVVAAEVAIRLEGEPEAVRRGDGVVEQQMFTLVVNARPGDIPPHLDVDLSGLEIGASVRVGDLVLPPGVTTDVDPEEPVVVAQASSVAADLEQVEAADEALPGGAADTGAQTDGDRASGDTSPAQGEEG